MYRDHPRGCRRAAALLNVLVALLLVAPAGRVGAASAAPEPGDATRFDTWVGYEVGRFLDAVVAADLNGDGWTDVAWARDDHFENRMQVQLNLGDGRLGDAVGYPATESSRDIAAGDLDRDGDLDLVVVGTGVSLVNNVIDLYFNDGRGGFTRRTATGGRGPLTLALADLNGDGAPDIALANYGSGSDASVLLNRGDGTFAPETRYPVGGPRPTGIVAADFDRDGDLDLAVARLDPVISPATVVVAFLVNDGTGRFSGPRSLGVEVFMEDPLLATGDWDGDGDPDLALSGTRPRSDVIIRNEGGGRFTTQLYPTDGSAVSLRAADVDQDGDLDLLSAEFGVVIRRNQGDGTFGADELVESGANPYDVTAADLTGDGRADLVVANRLTNTGAVHPQRADGSFAHPPIDENRATLPLSLAAADFDHDGDLDLAEGDFGQDSAGGAVFIMLNRGDGRFRPGQTILGAGGAVRAIHAADLNNDAFPDLVWAPDAPPYPFAYTLNRGDGTFGPVTTVPLQTCGTGQATTADVDNDGDQDVIVANNRSGPSLFCEQVSRTVRIALNNGDGTFQPDYGVAVDLLQETAIGVDLDQDGRTDLVAAGAALWTLRGIGGGRFAPFVKYDARGRDLTAGDLDGDGDLDVVSSDGSTANTYVLRNDGTGRFAQITAYRGEEISGYLNEFAVAVGDVDGDGALDIVVVNATGNNLAVRYGYGDGTFWPQQLRYGTNSGALDVVVGDFNRDRRLDLASTAESGSGLGVRRGVQALLNLNAGIVGDCTIVGTALDETLWGTAGDDVICGLEGNDTIVGADGNDVIRGGPGHDRLAGGAGSDRLLGEAGNDLISARDGVGGNDRVDGGPGTDRCRADAGDVVTGCP